jgi:hypothetical protein
MSPNASGNKSQASFSNGHEHALGEKHATALEKTAQELGISPWWLDRWLRQHELLLPDFVASNQFKALREKRTAADARARAVHEGPKPKHLAATNRQSAPQPARPRSRTNGGGATPAAAAAVPADDISQPQQVAHG